MSAWLLLVPLALLVLGIVRFISVLAPSRRDLGEVTDSSPAEVTIYSPRMETQLASFAASESQVIKEAYADR